MVVNCKDNCYVTFAQTVLGIRVGTFVCLFHFPNHLHNCDSIWYVGISII
jgi:hypothetical protein